MHRRCCLSRLVFVIFDEITCFLPSDLASTAGDLQYTLGKQDSAQWDAGADADSNPTLSFSYQDPTGQKNVKIDLICNDNSDGQLEALGETPPGSGSFGFQLSSKCSCWDGCSTKSL